MSSTSSFMHFGSPSPVSAESKEEQSGEQSSILTNDLERSAARDRAMTYAIAIAKEGVTTVEELISNAQGIFNYIYTGQPEVATAA